MALKTTIIKSIWKRIKWNELLIALNVAVDRVGNYDQYKLKYRLCMIMNLPHLWHETDKISV